MYYRSHKNALKRKRQSEGLIKNNPNSNNTIRFLFKWPILYEVNLRQTAYQQRTCWDC